MLRVKALQIVYAHVKKKDEGMQEAEKELMHSLERTYDLYLYFMQLLIKLTDYAAYRIDLARNKKLATDSDLHPNRKFVDNRVIKALREDQTLRNRSIDLGDADDLIREIYNNFQQCAADYLLVE